MRRLALAALAAVLTGGAAGCSKPVLRVADASLGDYYTDREYSKLSREQREEYCNDLATQDSLYLDEIREANSELQTLDTRRNALGSEVDSLLAEAERREQNIQTLLASRGGDGRRGAGGRRSNRGGSPDGERASGRPADGAQRWSVRPGDTLWRIAGRVDVYGNGAEWRRIYESNRGAVRDPDLIFPGQELSIPR